MPDSILQVRELTKAFQVRQRDRLIGTQPLYAVNGISFDLAENEVLGIVGESGCGKSTLGRLILRLVEPTSGEIRFLGRDLRALSKADLRGLRAEMQMVFQDPSGSLNPAMSVGRSIAESLRFHGVRSAKERRARAVEMLNVVGLEERHYDRLPHEMSGGQNQRVGIARALVVGPKLLVMDEAVSALDVSVQAQILKLLEAIRAEFKVGILFISHDLSVVRRVSHRVAVLYMGQVMEIATVDQLFGGARHPYSQGLLASRPSIDPIHRDKNRVVLKGDLPSPLDLPKGCPFASRCPIKAEKCWDVMPPVRDRAPGWTIACHNVD
jgi:oligopeptide transport system ATP-binding protein